MSACAIIPHKRPFLTPGTGTTNSANHRQMTNQLGQVLTDVASGKPDSVEACLRHFSGPVWSLARRYLRNDSDAEDATQDIFVELWKSAERFDPSLGSAMTFVMTLARRRLIDRNRKRMRTPEAKSLADAEEPSADEQVDGVELGDEVKRVTGALDELRPHQREVLELSLVQGRSHQQIADTTGMALGTVKSHARRGLMRVREMLGVKPPRQGGDA